MLDATSTGGLVSDRVTPYLFNPPYPQRGSFVSNARKLVSVNSPTLVLKRSEVSPQPTANDVATPAGGSSAGEPTGLPTRLGAFIALCGVTGALAYGGYSLYAAARDSFAVPTILSPSSEVVAATTLRLGELHVEQVRAVAEI